MEANKTPLSSDVVQTLVKDQKLQMRKKSFMEYWAPSQWCLIARKNILSAVLSTSKDLYSWTL